jgi:hypothetical protein
VVLVAVRPLTAAVQLCSVNVKLPVSTCSYYPSAEAAVQLTSLQRAAASIHLQLLSAAVQQIQVPDLE